MPRGLRARLLVTVLVAVAAALAATIAGFNLLLSHRLSAQATDVARARASARLAALTTAGGRIEVGEAPDATSLDGQVWVFDRQRPREVPAGVPAQVDAAARRLTSGGATMEDVASAHARLVALPVVVGGRRIGTVVAAVSLAAYERTRRAALIGSLALAALLLIVVALAAGWLLRSALRPVARMTADAADWSEHDLDRRFGLGVPRDELTRLAQTLDGFLDRLAASFRHERRFSAEVSHELRTPLAKIIAEGEFALRRPREHARYEEVIAHLVSHAHALSRTLEALLAGARYEANVRPARSDASEQAGRVVQACSALASEREVELRLDEPPRPLGVALEGELVARILQPLVENACRYARSRAWLSLAPRGGRVVVTVSDDGPGVRADEVEGIFEPGTRGSAAQEGRDAGAGLGLALSRRLAGVAGGEIEALPDPEGGRFEVRLPAA